MRRGSVVLVALLLGGCTRGPAPEATPRGAHDTPAAPAPALSTPRMDARAHLLVCDEASLFEHDVETQRQILQDKAGLRCRIEPEGGPFVVCAADAAVGLFGLPLHEVRVMPPDSLEQGLSVTLAGTPATVAAAAGAALGITLRAQDDDSWRSEGVREGRSFLVRADADGRAQFVCALPPPAEEVALPPVARPAGWGLLSGQATYPSEYLPPMRVCAVDAADPGRGYCVAMAQEAQFQLAVPPGRWWLLAWPQDTGTDTGPGRHSAASDCLAAAQTGCDDHALRAVEVAAGEHRGGLWINDWYADPHADPPPMEPRGEVVPVR